MKTKLMERIFSATELGEEKVLNQFQDDLNWTEANDELDAEEYSMKYSDSGILIHDKVNNEDTVAIPHEDNYDLVSVDELVDDPAKGCIINWLDSDGQLMNGEVIKSSGNDILVKTDNGTEVVDAGLISVNNESYADVDYELIANIDGHDCNINVEKGLLSIPEEKFVFKFNPSMQFNKILNLIRTKLATDKKLNKKIKKFTC